jgi:hypothetical protein
MDEPDRREIPVPPDLHHPVVIEVSANGIRGQMPRNLLQNVFAGVQVGDG